MSLRKSVIIEKAQTLALKGKFKQAIEEWKKLSAETPNDGNIYNAIGDLYLKTGDKKNAIEAFIQSADAFQSASFELKSIALCKKVLKIDPSMVEICEKLAAVYAERGLIGSAIDDYLKAAKHYFKQGDFRASLSVYRKISNLDPENVKIRIEIAEMCQKQDFLEEAVEEYKKVVALYDATNATVEAEEIREKIIALDPSYAGKDEVIPLEEVPEEAVMEDEGNVPQIPEIGLSTENTLTEEDNLNFLEPESEPMAEEQTVYQSDSAILLAEVTGNLSYEDNSKKSLEKCLSEAEASIQYGLLDKAIEQLRTATELYPLEITPHLKLKEIFAQQGMDEEARKECILLAELYRKTGDEMGREAVQSELNLLDEPLSGDSPDSNELPEAQDLEWEVKVNPSEDGIPSLDVGKEDDFFGQSILEEPSPSFDMDEPTLAASEGSLSGNLPSEEEQEKYESSEGNEDLFSDPVENVANPEYIDLNAILSEDLEDDPNEHTLDKTIRFFQVEARDDQKEKEAETQYDLGIAYKEMGMMSEAMKAFEFASQGESRFEDAMIVLSACYRERESSASAAKVLQKAISDRNCQPGEMIALKYELALIYEELGDIQASSLYEEIFNTSPTFRDVGRKYKASQFDDISPSSVDLEQKKIIQKPKTTQGKGRVSYL